MPATPAWPPASTPRLFVDRPLTEGLAIALDGAPANYLSNVMRLVPGDPVRLFDDRTGEWLARMTETGRKRVSVEVVDALRPRERLPDLWLLFAPVKKAAIDWLVEKATELGAARLCPVLTQRTVVDRVNLGRLRAIAIEAAEQCGRTALPEIAQPARLADMLKQWPAERALLFADETGGPPLAGAAAPPPAAILIGPEGGFAPDEAAMVRTVPQARSVSLGPRILRAETAAAAALAVWMSAAGDWRQDAGQQAAGAA